MSLTIITAAIVLVIGVALMCVFLLKKDGEFPKFDVGSNPEMHKRGIYCFKDVDAQYHSPKKRACSGDLSADCKDCGFYNSENNR